MGKKRNTQFLGRWSKVGPGPKPKGPGRNTRKGITLPEIIKMFPDSRTAESWFEKLRWGRGMYCPRCGCDDEMITDCRGRNTMPYWCGACRRRFSVRTGTPLEASNIPLQKWAIAIYLHVTSLKGVSSMKLHRDLGISQSAAWFMSHRIREAWSNPASLNSKEAEVDESYFGGIEKNKHAKKRLYPGSGGAGKTIVAGMKDRRTGKVIAKIVPNTGSGTLRSFVIDNLRVKGTLYSDGASTLKDFKWPGKSEFVIHSKGQFATDGSHTNGIESFWAMLKRAYKGTYHQISPKHLQRYLDEFCARNNIRDKDTIDQMRECVRRMAGKRLKYKDLVGKQ